jgi:hypothetical protein
MTMTTTSSWRYKSRFGTALRIRSSVGANVPYSNMKLIQLDIRRLFENGRHRTDVLPELFLLQTAYFPA